MDGETVTYDRRQGCCMHCGSLSFSQEWLNAFQVTICNSCKSQEELVSKGNAKSLYMLTDGDLKKLGSLAKANPQKQNWAPMRLYMLSQVEAAAHKKHGGPEGIEEARTHQMETKVERRATKRKEEARKEEAHTEKLKRIKERIAQDEQQRVQHAVAEEVIDGATGKGRRTFEDGATVEVERI